jgi:tetratricopeptide (TPR) repeat protein
MNLQKYIDSAQKALQDQKYEIAVQFFDKAIELAPTNAKLYSERGVTHFHLKHNLKALADMDKAVELEPENSYRYSSRAFIKGACRMTDDAIADYQKCIELDPDDAIAYNNLGLLQEQLGWKKQANDNFDKADTLEGVLKDRNINLPQPEGKVTDEMLDEIIKKPAQMIESKEKEETTPSKMEVAKSVFTNKSVFKEFIAFIKNGFKIKK